MSEEQSNKRTKRYIGYVNVDGFRVRDKHYPKGSKYNCKDKKSYDYLKSINKIK